MPWLPYHVHQEGLSRKAEEIWEWDGMGWSLSATEYAHYSQGNV
jgi:hypothetical protein